MRVVVVCAYPPGNKYVLARRLVPSGVDPFVIVADEEIQTVIESVLPIDLVLVFGKQIQRDYSPGWFGTSRILELPDPSDEWNDDAIFFAARFVQEGKHDLSLQFRNGRLYATELIPF